MRVMWKGAVSFGLVTIPIHLYAATESKNVTLRQVHEADGGRIQYKRVCTVDGEEVPYADIAKGYELSDGGMVVLTDKELSELPISTSRSIDVQEFVTLEAIDPIYYDKSYYLEPRKAAVKPYVLLRDALHKSGQVAITKVAIRQRESLAVLRVVSDVMVLTTMLWPDEVREADFPFLREDQPDVRSQEMSMAASLIDSLSDSVFEPEKYQDSYREALLQLIESKVEGKDTTPAPAAKAETEVTDLMSALQASVSAAKEARGAGGDEDSDGSRKTSRSSGDTDEESDSSENGSSKGGSSSRSTPKSTASKSTGTKPTGTKSTAGKSTKTTKSSKSGSSTSKAKSSGSTSGSSSSRSKSGGTKSDGAKSGSSSKSSGSTSGTSRSGSAKSTRKSA